jgi:hypothetical protein
VFKDKGTALGLVAPEAAFVFRKQGSSSTYVSRAFMRRVAVDATDSSFGHGMMTRQIVLSTHIRVALITDGFFGARRVDRQARSVAGGLRAPGGKTVRRFDLTA